MYVNDVTLGFSSKNYGSQNLFRFSRTYQFLAQIIVELELPNGFIAKSDFISYSSFDEVKFTIGGTELLSINGKQMLNIVLEQCETLEKKEELLNMAGRRNFTTTSANGNPNTEIDVQTNIAINANQNKYVYAIIPCPWSSLSCMNKIYPLPLHMLSEPIEMQIVFKQGDEFRSDTSTAFSKANLHFRYGKLGSNEQLKSQIYRYPIHNHFTREYTIASGVDSVDLTGFRKGECTQLLFHFVPTDVDSGIDSSGVSDKRYFDGIEVDNLKLTFNGQIIWQMPNKEHRAWNLIDGIGAECRFNKRKFVIKNSSDNVPVLGLQINTHLVVNGDVSDSTGIAGIGSAVGNKHLQGRYIYYRIPISEIRAELQKQGHYLGADFTKQSLQLTFDPPKARKTKVAALPANVATKLYMTYTYRSEYQLDGEAALLIM